MNKYTIALLFFNALFIFFTMGDSVCPQASEFPPWMRGNFLAEFSDGSSANRTTGIWYANITLSNGQNGTLTMTKPMDRSDHFYICHDCVLMQGAEPQQHCSLLIPNCNGYTEYVYKAPELVSTCPESTSSPGLEKGIIERTG